MAEETSLRVVDEGGQERERWREKDGEREREQRAKGS